MKKILTLLCVVLIGSCALADEIMIIKGVNMNNFWRKKGIDEEKVIKVGQKILLDNHIPKYR